MKSIGNLRRLLPGTIGAQYERSTERYLNRSGLRTMDRNYRCRGGEIDLVMEDDDTIVFVEVRYRSDAGFGDPLETITPSKQRRIIHAARHFLAKHTNYRDRACRFDAVGVCKSGSGIKYDWIKDAFST